MGKKPDQKSFNERNDPCYKEQQASYTCLEKNDYDHEKCQMYFDNYTGCRKFWTQIVAMRRTQGIKPEMPDAEERVKIKAERTERLKDYFAKQ